MPPTKNVALDPSLVSLTEHLKLSSISIHSFIMMNQRDNINNLEAAKEQSTLWSIDGWSGWVVWHRHRRGFSGDWGHGRRRGGAGAGDGGKSIGNFVLRLSLNLVKIRNRGSHSHNLYKISKLSNQETVSGKKNNIETEAKINENRPELLDHKWGTIQPIQN